MSNNRECNPLIKGLITTLLVNAIVWLMLLFIVGNIKKSNPILDVLIRECIEKRNLNLPSIELAVAFNFLYLVTGSVSILQFLYVIPAIIKTLKDRQWEFMQGIIIAAVVTALLTGQCFTLVLQC